MVTTEKQRKLEELLNELLLLTGQYKNAVNNNAQFSVKKNLRMMIREVQIQIDRTKDSARN